MVLAYIAGISYTRTHKRNLKKIKGNNTPPLTMPTQQKKTSSPRSCPIHPEGNTPRKEPLASKPVPKVTLLWKELEAFGGDILYEPREGSLWVRTPASNKLVKYNSDGRVIHRMPPVNFRAANGRLCHDSKRGWVVTCDERRVVCHNLDGALTREVKVKGALDLEGVMYCRNADIYVVSDVKKSCLYTINAETGLVAGSFGSRGTKYYDSFDQPGYLCLKHSAENECGCSHHIVVSDKGNNCVKVFTSGGEFIRRFGRAGSGNGELNAPCGVCEDTDGKILVCDSGNCRVVKFWVDDDKEMFEVVLAPDQLDNSPPEGITVTKEGHLVVGKADGRGTMACFKIDK